MWPSRILALSFPTYLRMAGLGSAAQTRASSADVLPPPPQALVTRAVRQMRKQYRRMWYIWAQMLALANNPEWFPPPPEDPFPLNRDELKDMIEFMKERIKFMILELENARIIQFPQRSPFDTLQEYIDKNVARVMAKYTPGFNDAGSDLDSDDELPAPWETRR